jgi:hypothetical protein
MRLKAMTMGCGMKLKKKGWLRGLSIPDLAEEIKGISMNPQKTCGFTPYLMFMVEDVTSRSFPKEGKHMPFGPKHTKEPLIPPA